MYIANPIRVFCLKNIMEEVILSFPFLCIFYLWTFYSSPLLLDSRRQVVFFILVCLDITDKILLVEGSYFQH